MGTQTEIETDNGFVWNDFARAEERGGIQGGGGTGPFWKPIYGDPGSGG